MKTGPRKPSSIQSIVHPLAAASSSVKFLHEAELESISAIARIGRCHRRALSRADNGTGARSQNPGNEQENVLLFDGRLLTSLGCAGFEEQRRMIDCALTDRRTLVVMRASAAKSAVPVRLSLLFCETGRSSLLVFDSRYLLFVYHQDDPNQFSR